MFQIIWVIAALFPYLSTIIRDQGQNKFKTIQTFQVSAAACAFKPTFPRVFGGIIGHTKYTGMDEYNGNIAVGGWTNDTDLVTGGSKPIIAYIPIGGQMLWAKAVDANSTNNYVADVTVTKTYVVFTLDNNNAQTRWIIIRLKTEDGSFKDSYKSANDLIGYQTMESLHYDESTNFFYLGITEKGLDGVKKFAVMMFSDNNNAQFQPKVFYKYTAESYVTATFHPGGWQYYTGGLFVWGGNYYLALTVWGTNPTDLPNNMGGQYNNYHFAQGSGTPYHRYEKINVLEAWPAIYIYGCTSNDSGGSPTVSYMTFIKTDSNNCQVNKIVQVIFAQYFRKLPIYMKCIGIIARTTASNILYLDPTTQILKYYYVDWNSLTNWQKFILDYSPADTTIVSATIISEYNLYYFGSTTSITKISKTFSKIVGFVQRMDNAFTQCLTYPTNSTSLSLIQFTPFTLNCFGSDNEIRNYPSQKLSTEETITLTDIWKVNNINNTKVCANLDTYTVTAPAVIAKRQYILGSGTQSWTQSAFSSNGSGCTDFVWLHQVSLENQQPIPSFMTWTGKDRKLVVDTSDMANVGNYTLNYTGTINTGVWASITFVIEVIPKCYYASVAIDNTKIADQTYDISNGTFFRFLTQLSWALSNLQNGCSSNDLDYTYLIDSTNMSPDPTVIYSNKNNGIGFVNTTDVSKIGTYDIRIDAMMSGQLKGSSQVFYITVVDECSKGPIVAPTQADLIYFLSDPSVNTTLSEFTDTSGICGKFTYTLTANGTSVSSPFNYMTSTRSLLCSTSSTSYIAITDFNYTATLAIGGTSQSITFSYTIMINPCKNAVITAPTYSDQILFINKPNQVSTIPAFDTNATGYNCGAWIYTITPTAGGAIDPIFTVNAAAPSITMTTTDIAKKALSPYSIQVVGYQGTYTEMNATLSFKIYINYYDPTDCPKGYFFDGKVCSRCDSPCSQCVNTSTTCLWCDNLYYFLDDGSNSCMLNVDPCPVGTYKDLELEACRGCPTYCETCSSMDSCNVCISTYTLNNGQCMSKKECSENYRYEQTNNTCTACPANCVTCSSATNCTYCSAGYYRDETSGTCVSSCNPGTFADSNSQSCMICQTDCAECNTNNYTCTKCKTGSYLFNQTCVKRCPYLGYYQNPTTNHCDECQLGCEICINSATDCITCLKGYARTGRSCSGSCSDNYYLTPQEVCFPCDPACLKCNGSYSYQCQTCNPGFYLFETTCSTTCPNLMFTDDTERECASCAYYCANCTSQTSCQVCNSGYIIIPNGCSGEYYLKTTGSYALSVPMNTSALALVDPSESTFEIWFQSSDVNSTTTQVIVGLTPYKIRKVANNNSIELLFNNTSSFCSDNIIQQDQWYHFAFAIRESPASLTCYLNGQQISTGSNSIIAITKNVTKSTEITLGGTTTISESSQKFIGFLREFRWWKKYRTQFYINGFKNIQISSYLNDMYAYWRLDEKNDGSITAYSDKANTLTYNPTPKTVASLQSMREVYLKLCPEGQYPDFNYTLGYQVCLNCDSTCKSCTNATASNCTDCNSPLKLLQAENKCILVDTCPDGYYQDLITGLCTPCTSTCQTCVNNPDQCPICKKGYFRQYQGSSCVKECPTGMYGNYTTQQCFFNPIITILQPFDGDDYAYGDFLDLIGTISYLNKELNTTLSFGWQVIREYDWLDISEDVIKAYTGENKLKVHLENKVLQANNYYNISLYVRGNNSYYKGFNASSSIKIYIGIPPKNGKCITSKSTGKADLDVFTLTQPDWIDPSGIAKYDFSYSIDGGLTYVPIESEDWTKPTVDLKFPQIYEDYQVTIRCSATNIKGFVGTSTTSIGLLKKTDANATNDLLVKFKLGDLSSEADFVSNALQLNLMAESIGSLVSQDQNIFDPKIESTLCNAQLCWGRGSCMYSTFTKKYYCNCGSSSEGSNCTFANNTVLYLLQTFTSTLSIKYLQLYERDFQYEFLKLNTQYKEQLNDTSLPILIDILRTKVWQWNGKFISQEDIQKHLEILSNLMEYIEYDIIRQNNTGYWQNKTLKLVQMEENIGTILDIFRQLVLITRNYLNQMTSSMQFTTRMFAFRQQIITQESILTIQATNQSKIISTLVKISPANFINASFNLEDTFIVEAIEYAVNPYQIMNLNNLATNAFELKFYNYTIKNQVAVTSLSQGLEFAFPASDNQNVTEFLVTYNGLSPFKTLQKNKRNQLIQKSGMACTFWNGTSWDATGCKFKSLDTTHIRCLCTHLTTFGTLFSTPVLTDVATTEDSSLIKAGGAISSQITLEELIRWPIMDYINNLQELLQHKQPTLIDFLFKPGVYVVLVFWFFYITSIVFYSGKDRMKRYNMTKSQNRDDLAEIKNNEAQCLDMVIRDLIIRDHALLDNFETSAYVPGKKHSAAHNILETVGLTQLTPILNTDKQCQATQQQMIYEEMPKELKKKYKKRARRKIFGKVGTLSQRAKRFYKRTIKKTALSAEAKSQFFNEELKLNLWFGLMAKTSKIAPRHVRVTLMYFHIAYHLFMSSFIHIFKLQAYIIDDEGMFKYITLSGIIVFSAQIISLPLALIFRMPMSVRRMIEGVKTKKVNKAYIELDRQMGWRYAIGYFFCICTYIVATFTVLFFNYFYPQDYCISWMMNLAFLYLIDYLLLTFSFAGIQLLNVIISSKLKCWYHVWATLEKYRYIKNLRG